MSSYLEYLTKGSYKGELVSKLEYYKEVNRALEQDLKCEHDEKVELVKIKVNLENEVLNLRDTVRSLEVQAAVLMAKISELSSVPTEDSGLSGVNSDELETMQRKIIVKIERELEGFTNKHIVDVLKIEVNNKIKHIIQNFAHTTNTK